MPLNEEFLKHAQGKEFLSGQEISSIDSENRTVDIVFFAGADIPRMDYWTGQRYTLRFDPNGADLSYLNNGAPILDNHESWTGTAGQKGRVEKAWKDELFKATLRFSKRKSVDETWQDVEDRIITKFSMGVEILESEKFQEKGNEIRLAKKWRPFEISMAPIPADFGTTTLSADHGGLNNNNPGTCPGGNEMPDTVTGTSAQTIETEALRKDATEELRKAAIDVERLRSVHINEVGAKHKLSADFIQKHIKEGTTVESFNAAVLNHLAERDANHPPTVGEHTELVADAGDKVRLAMGVAVDEMMGVRKQEKDNGNQFQGLKISRIAEESVRLQFNVGGPINFNNPDHARLAMQQTSDFANVLENSARKKLLKQYEMTPTTYQMWASRSTSPDFKTMSRSRLSEAPSLLPVLESGQITIAAMSDSKEQYALATYGRGVSFTRQMLINDDLGAFNNLVGMFGGQAARKANAVVYAILTANAAMSDSVNLFDASHSNSGTGVIGNTGLDAGYAAMRKQKGLDGSTILDIQPKYLIVPVAKETTARQAMTTITGNVKSSDQNWFAGRFEVVADPVLDASSTTVWYLAADPAIYPGVEYCFLDGAEGPQIIRQENQNGILGIQLYCFMDFAAKAVDFRSLYYSTGA